MIGTIRKHSKWLWLVVAVATIISFIWWGASPGTRNGDGRVGGLGKIYGETITAKEFQAAEKEFSLYYLHHVGEFPDRNANISRTDIERETYIRLLLARKAAQLGMHVSVEAQQAAAIDFLSRFGRDGQVPQMSLFVEKILAPEGLTAEDFQRYIIDDVQIEQFVQSMGLAGGLVPPQEAAQLYDRDHQEVSAQVVFFSATNYLSQVTVNPAEIPLFYTNFMAHYRLPDRVQLNYVQFDLTNYLTAAETKTGKTNLTAEVESVYAKDGMKAVPDAKTPEEAKAKIRDMIIRHDAMQLAAEKAMEFVRPLFAMDPPNAENLVTFAKTNGLKVYTTTPFSKEEGPQEFAAPTELTETAFKLSADSPFSKPIAGAESVYVIGLAKALPNGVPPLSEIHDTVVRDYKNYEAALKAQAAGTNFYYTAVVQMAAGKTFAQAALAAGQTPVALKPFSLSSRDVPEAEGRAELNEIKQAAFTTPPGHLSPLQPSGEGGFVMYVQSLLPVDEKLRTTELPRYLTQIRRGREQEMFNLWLQNEFARELRNLPNRDEIMGRKQAPR